MLYYFSIVEFFHAIAVIPMQVLLLCLYYAHFIIEKTRWIWRGTNVPPTGICLSLLFIVAAVTDGQNVTVLMWIVAFPSSVSWRYLIYLLPCDNLRMHLAIIPAQCSNAFGLQLFLHYAQHNQLKPISRCTIMQIREMEQIHTYNWHQNVTEHNTTSGHTIYSPMHNIAVDCGSG